jgi:uncharacterized membrane protein (DUF485 family)
MTKTSLKELERLYNAAPEPTEPDASQEALQTQGDNPNTPISNLTAADLVNSQIVRRHELANEKESDEIIRQRHLDELRDQYIPWIFLIKVCWLGFVVFCVLTVGWHQLYLSDTVLITILTTTTATVLGVFVIVAKWLFPSK